MSRNRADAIVRLVCGLATIWAAQLRAGGVDDSKFSIVPRPAGQYEIIFQHVTNSPATLSPAERSEDLPPAFARVVEVPAGRSASIASIELGSVSTLPAKDGLGWKIEVDSCPLLVSIARMGGRAFMRAEVRPYQYDGAVQRWSHINELRAWVQLSESNSVGIRPAALRNSIMPLSATPACSECPPKMPTEVGAGEGGTSVDFQARRSVTNEIAWRIGVTNAGFFRITGAALMAAGYPSNYLDSSIMTLSVRDRVIPVWRSSAGPMGAADWIGFYGAVVDSRETAENVYWLSVGTPSPVVPAAAAPNDSLLGSISTSRQLIRYAPRSLYRPSYRPLEDSFDHWFANQVNGNTTSNILFATPHPSTTGIVQLAFSLQGLNTWTNTGPDHRTIVRIAGQMVASNDYKGEVAVSGVGSVSGTVLQVGVTTVSVQQVLLPGIPTNAASAGSAYLEFLELCYERRLIVDQYPYFFSSADSAVNLVISNVLASARLVDVSDPYAPSELTSVTKNGTTWRFRAEASRCYALFNDAITSGVKSIELVRFRNLSDTQRVADYLVVTPEELREPAFRLLRHRYKNNLQVQAATTKSVFDEFAYGLRLPEAIRQYFGFAFHHYAVRPQYALLVGVGSYDPVNDLGYNRAEYIPVKMGAAPFRRTALDQWFVTVDGPDLLPDIKLGRLPVSDTTGLSNAIRKIITYDTAATNAAWRSNALLVADKIDTTFDFKTNVVVSTLPKFIAGGFDQWSGIQTVYRDDITVVQATTNINTAIDQGVQFVHYMGHGSVEQWSSPLIWNTTNAASRVNTAYPVFGVFSCQVGAFQEPDRKTLAEVILASSGGGSGCLAPTALSVQQRAEYISDGFYQALLTDRVPHLGDAVAAGLLNLYGFNAFVSELQFYSLFGDPALKVWGGALR